MIENHTVDFVTPGYFTDQHSPRIFHLISKEHSRSEYLIDFSSENTQTQIIDKISNVSLQGCANVLSSLTEIVHPSMKGGWFEAFCHKVLARGGTFKTKVQEVTDFDSDSDSASESGGSLVAESGGSLVLARHNPTTYSDSGEKTSVADNSSYPLYYITERPNFPTFDSFIVQETCILTFQMTVASSHSVVEGGFNKLKLLFKDKNINHYFVVPEEVLMAALKSIQIHMVIYRITRIVRIFS